MHLRIKTILQHNYFQHW